MYALLLFSQAIFTVVALDSHHSFRRSEQTMIRDRVRVYSSYYDLAYILKSGVILTAKALTNSFDSLRLYELMRMRLFQGNLG